MENWSDEELACCWKKRNDENAADILYKRYEKRIFLFINRKIGNFHDTQDLLSETFAKVVQHISQWKGGSFRAWVYTIARHVVVDYFKGKAKKREIHEDRFNEGEIVSTTEIDIEEENLKDYLHSIPPKYREIILLRCIDELTLKELAEMFNLSTSRIDQIVKESFDILRSDIKIKTLFEENNYE